MAAKTKAPARLPEEKVSLAYNSGNDFRFYRLRISPLSKSEDERLEEAHAEIATLLAAPLSTWQMVASGSYGESDVYVWYLLIRR